ncbi:GNAT family N-acetyltransferase [Desulfobulbus sp.]|uniref:GNAT family N-acetyltransferase n=1 Tax=Desulfobulbus sp. TaxID=895 RepID=UPI00286F87E3|nr:GNAT family N-acetyltransferase [Desulfobulbus sp.]
MVDWGCMYKYEDEGIMPIRTRGTLLSISRAKKEDLHDILELQYMAYQSEAALLDNYEIPPLKQTFEDIKSEFSKSIFLKVTDENNKIVGSVRGRITEGALFIGKLIVDPDLQGEGIGKKLLQEIERIGECNRCELFTSSKSIRNIGLYENVGYLIFKEEQVSDGLSFIYLQKTKKD